MFDREWGRENGEFEFVLECLMSVKRGFGL